MEGISFYVRNNSEYLLGCEIFIYRFFWGGMMKPRGISLVVEKTSQTDCLLEEDENGRKDECLLKK